MNLLVLPGLGSFLARRRVAGAAQALLAGPGFAMSFWWVIQLGRQWNDEGYFPWDGGPHFRLGFTGFALWAVAWVWALTTSLSVIYAARTE